MFKIKKLKKILLGVLNFNHVDLVNQSFLVLVKYIMGVSCMFERIFLLRFPNFNHMCHECWYCWPYVSKDFLVLMHVHGVRVVFFGRFFNLNHNDYEFGLDVSKIYLFIFIYSILVSSNVGYGYILLRYLFY
jgi:hypothetical protein